MLFNADNRDPTSSLLPPARPPAAADVAAELLREEILAGRFRSGDQLRETHISARLGLSRNTIREAYRKLETEGLVTHVPHYGVYVTKLDVERVRELYAFRRITEVGSLAALTRGEAVELGQALAAICSTPMAKGNAYRDMAERNGLFHLAIVASSKSPELMATAESIMGQMQLYLLNRSDRFELHERSEVHHRPIVEALLRGDHHGAAMLMRTYLANAFATIAESPR